MDSNIIITFFFLGPTLLIKWLSSGQISVRISFFSLLFERVVGIDFLLF